MTLAFMYALFLSTTVLAAGWNLEYKDNDDNEWYIETETVKVDKNSDGTLEFHANFSKVFSEQGLKKEEENFRATGGKNFPGDVKLEMQCIHFKEEGGKLYSCITDSFYCDSNGKPIPEFSYIDHSIEWYEINQNSVASELFKVAKKYV